MIGLMRKVLSYVRPQDWGWIHFKFAIGVVWPVLTLCALPETVENSVNRSLTYVWFGLTIVGAVVCMLGIVMSAQPGRCSVLGISVELVGLILLFTGPFLFFLLFLGMGFAGAGWRPVGIGLTYGLSAAMAARFVMVVPKYLREAHDPTKET